MFKHDNPSTNINAFDIDKALNQNLDKIDTAFGQDRTRITTLENDNTTNKQDISNIKQEQISQDDYIEELQAENERLRNDLNTLPSKSATGEVISLDKVSDARFKKFVISGNSKQETREGYNLIDIASNIITGSNSGLTASFDNDGYIVVNGTAERTYIHLLKAQKDITDLLEDGETYTLWQENVVETANTGIYAQVIASKTDGSGYIYYTSASSAGNYVTIKVNKSTCKSYKLSVQTGNSTETFSNYKNRFMLVKGSYNSNTIPAYELYGVMPSPDFPSEVKTVKGNASVVVCNKNLCKLYKNRSISVSGLTITIENNTEITINGTSTAQNWIEIGYKFSSGTVAQENKIITLNKEKTYMLSRKILSGTVSGSTYVNFQLVKSSSSGNANVSNATESRQITGSDGIYRIYIYFTAGTEFSNYKMALQIEENETVTDYVAHQNQSFTIPFGDLELCKIDSYKDYIYKRQRTWYKHTEVPKYIVTGTENWSKSTATTVVDRFSTSALPKSTLDKKSGYCNMLRYGQGEKEGTFYIDHWSNANRLIINLTEYGTYTLQTFKQKLQELYANGTPLVVYYPTSDIIDEEITDAALIKVLDQIEKTAHSYQGKTHIYSTDELSPIFDVEAFIDLNEVIGG